LIALQTHDSSVAVCGAKLVAIARKVSNALAKLSEFITAITTGTPVYTLPWDSKQLTLYCARRISEQAAARRKTVAELLHFHHVVDDLARFRLRWWRR
jgi:hypothetical protein